MSKAPEEGTYNEKFGPGLGIEQMGVEPDILVDNNPRTAYDGKDTQLETAINVLASWLAKEPVAVPKAPTSKRNMAYDDSQSCQANP
jgi:C-terminal processing protease CtpA/Prc